MKGKEKKIPERQCSFLEWGRAWDLSQRNKDLSPYESLHIDIAAALFITVQN